MKAIIASAAAATLAMFTLMQAVGADAPSRPPGVSAANWAPIGDNLGVVVDATAPPVGYVSPQPPADLSVPLQRQVIPGGGGMGAGLIAPINGYLMVRRGTVWQRLILVEPVKGPGAAG